MIVYGINPVLEALKSRPSQVSKVLITRGKSTPRLQAVIELARREGVPLRFEPEQALERKAQTPRHQDVVAEISGVSTETLEAILDRSPRRILLVDGIEDPRNLGAVLRTAEASGIDAVLLPDRHATGITPVAVKASAGAALHLPVARIGNVAQTLDRLKEAGFWAVGLDMTGTDDVRRIDPKLALVIVVGGEHRGVRRLVKERCDFLVALPMKGRVSSLNLSVAAGVLLYQLLWLERSD